VNFLKTKVALKLIPYNLFCLVQDASSNMLLMSSAGHIYSQAMDEESSAKHGPFYVTNTLEVYHPEIKVSVAFVVRTN
jgi:E3 ubiquitin-protein ligase UBR4